MDVTVTIVIPTAGRAAAISTHKYIDNTIICCPESELALYKKHNPKATFDPHPDSIIGIALKRQWIWNKYPNVFMADDDLKGLNRLTVKKGQPSTVPADAAYDIIQNCANLARLTGCYLFGFNPYVVPEHYVGEHPFVMSGYINGCGLGLLDGAQKKLKFNAEIATNNDFYICGLNAFYYRKCFIDYRFSMMQDSFGDNIGGCADVRTRDVEKRDYELLREFFGNAISLKNIGATKAKHAHSKRLTVPY